MATPTLVTAAARTSPFTGVGVLGSRSGPGGGEELEHGLTVGRANLLELKGGVALEHEGNRYAGRGGVVVQK